MSRFALSLLLLGAMAPAAHAEGTRSLGVTVSPGAYAVTRVRSGVATGISGSIDWEYRAAGAWTSWGGHVASSTVFTEATPFRVRFGPPLKTVKPFVGLGASMLLPWATQDASSAASTSSLRMGGEVSAGVGVEVTPAVFLSGEGRYQNFSLVADPLSNARQELFSAYLGLGIRL